MEDWDERGWSREPDEALALRVADLGLHKTRPADYTLEEWADAWGTTPDTALEALGKLQSAMVVRIRREWVDDWHKSVPVGAEFSWLSNPDAWLSARESRIGRARACRDALLDWTYHQQAGVRVPLAAFLGDVRASHYGRSFSMGDAVLAATQLRELGLIIYSRELKTVVGITTNGALCIEEYNGKTGDWVKRLGVAVTNNGPVFNGAVGNANVATGGNAHQHNHGGVTIQQRLEISSATRQMLAAVASADVDQQTRTEAVNEVQALAETLTTDGVEPEQARGAITQFREKFAGSAGEAAGSAVATAAGGGLVALWPHISPHLASLLTVFS